MTVSQKAALSLLIAVFLFAGFAVLAYTGLFDLVEARFYNPSITRSLNREIAGDAENIETFLSELQTRFAATLDETAVRRSFLPNQSAEDIFERTRLYGVLQENLGGLRAVQFVDSGGMRIHFSTLSRDVLRQDLLSMAYRNYNEDDDSLPYDEVAVQNRGDPRLILDEAGDCIIFAFPFYDSFDVYRGTALFTLSMRAVAERLIAAGRIRIGENVVILSSPPGVLMGLPGSERTVLPMVSSVWADGILALTPIDSAVPEVSLALISAKTSLGIFVGRLVSEDLFTFPQTMKVILLVSFFLTIYLAIFLFFNLKQDTMTVIQSRLKDLQISIIEQYYERKGDIDWNHWARELEQRREDVRSEVKRGMAAKKGRRSDENIDALIDKSWDELLSVISRQRPAASGIDEEKLQSILNRILSSAPVLAAGSAVQAQTAPPAAEASAPAEEVEEVEEVEAVEELEDAEEIETIDEAEPVGEDEVLEEVEEAEEAETIEDAGDTEIAEEVTAAGNASAKDASIKNAGAEITEAAGKDEAVEEVEPAEAAGEGKTKTAGGLLSAAEKKQSNIKLAFGDDDIPYIVETSGLELVDEDINAAMSGFNRNDEPEEVEELEELDEDSEKAEERDGSKNAPPGPSSQDVLAKIASEIEFSPLPEIDDAGAIHENLDIVSPFATMLSNISVEPSKSGEASEIPAEAEPGETAPPVPDDNTDAAGTEIFEGENTEAEIPPSPQKKNPSRSRKRSRKSSRKKSQ
ncbi:MAG: hypothetical protein LBD71_05975 [Treponema sp.]|nr:hypothetical protein [Treponema sp.]